MPNFCGKCGTKAEPGQKFCKKCGAALAVPVTGAASQIPQQVLSYQQPTVNNLQQVAPNIIPVVNNPPVMPVNVHPAGSIPQQRMVNPPHASMPIPPQSVHNKRVDNAAQTANDTQYDWNRVQPRKKSVGGVAIILALSVLIMGFVLIIWSLSVAVGS